MSSIQSRSVIDKLIAGNGKYPGDSVIVVEILEYENIFDGGTTYKLIYSKDDAKYIKSNLACRAWKSIWKREAK
jgi:hypothetical protein